MYENYSTRFNVGAFSNAFFILLMLIPFVKYSPVTFVLVGSYYALLIINSAINIANFEMSKVGQFVERANSDEYKKIDVVYYK